MSQKNIIITILLVLVVVAGAWFMWQRRGVSEETALNKDIESEINAMNSDIADLESQLK